MLFLLLSLVINLPLPSAPLKAVEQCIRTGMQTSKALCGHSGSRAQRCQARPPTSEQENDRTSLCKGVIKPLSPPPWECECLELALKPIQSSARLCKFKRTNLVCKSLMRPWSHRRNLQTILLIPTAHVSKTARHCLWPCLHFLQFLRKETAWLKKTVHSL